MMDLSIWKEDLYLKTQLLSYLGNKRRLLPFLTQAIRNTGLPLDRTTFVDLFAGSGVVSRLAKKMGVGSIIVNDWEHYSSIIQSLYIKENPNSIKELFEDRGGLEKVLEKLNTLEDLPKGAKFYMSRYYAPAHLHNFDPKRERLFYTPFNARKIDIIRSTIEDWYPSHKRLSSISEREKNILIALLLYESSVHNNTGGVFKAYYKEFGGYGHHALNRILAPIKLPYPILEEGTSDVKIFQKDAQELAKNLPINTDYSLCYLDPPYNIHQYGSNYHILNTIAKWDHLPLEDSYTHEGTLKHKAGIRKDWIETRSPFCSKLTAKESFSHLIENIHTDALLISYSTDGLIDFKDMVDILKSKGDVNILFNPYVKYPAGKKSLQRKNQNWEVILYVNTRKKSNPKTVKNIFENIKEKKAEIDLRGIYKLNKIFFETFERENENTYSLKKVPHVKINLNNFGELINIEGLKLLGEKEREKVLSVLEFVRCQDKKEELEVLFNHLRTFKQYKEALPLWKKILGGLKFLAYPKAEKEFLFFYKKGEELLKKHSFPKEHSLVKQWENLTILFVKRKNYVER